MFIWIDFEFLNFEVRKVEKGLFCFLLWINFIFKKGRFWVQYLVLSGYFWSCYYRKD